MIDYIIAIKEVQWVKINKINDETVLKISYMNPNRNNANWMNTQPRIILTSRKSSIAECIEDMISKLVDCRLVKL